MATDFDDITPTPDPTPKKHFLLTPRNDSVTQPIPWPAGTTFQAALVAALPATIRNKTNATPFQITLVIDSREI